MMDTVTEGCHETRKQPWQLSAWWTWEGHRGGCGRRPWGGAGESSSKEKSGEARTRVIHAVQKRKCGEERNPGSGEPNDQVRARQLRATIGHDVTPEKL